MRGDEGHDSQTASSAEASDPARNHFFDDAVADHCTDEVDNYRRGTISKSDAFVSIQTSLVAAKARHGGAAPLGGALATYLGMLDEVDRGNRDAGREGGTAVSREASPRPGIAVRTEEPDRVRRSSSSPRRDGVLDAILGKGKGRAPTPSESESDERRGSKRHRASIDESLFPWGPSSAILEGSLSPELREILIILDNWSNDPTYVVRKILLAPGAPDFPPDQWLNIVKGLAVDLDKVLGSHYSTDVDTKQTRDVGDIFQLSLRIPKQTKVVRSHGEWVIAFGKTVQATSFALPQRNAEHLAWQTYISQLFASVQLSHHDRVIQFDKAARLRVANQKHLRLSHFADFDDLRTIHLSPFGVGPSSADRGGGRSRRGDGGPPSASHRECCHKWNRGACDKSAAECQYEHVCDKRGCRGAHRRPDCPRA